jgi:predicted RNA binding protein YcfA (HicA-like mRNA interferase family)
MPPKIRDLIDRLQKAGYSDRGGKGSHRNFVHPVVPKSITISGNQGDDARIYQIRAVNKAIEEAQK